MGKETQIVEIKTADAMEQINEVAENLGANVKIAPAHGIASLALSLAMKFHDINTVQDGVLYQQYKMEGKNMTGLHIDMVFETAMRIEAYLLASSERIAGIVLDALVTDDEEGTAESQQTDESAP